MKQTYFFGHDTPKFSNKTIEDAIKNGYVLVRAIRNPGKTRTSSRHNETSFELELRKINRKIGYPTYSKEKSDVNGNPNRSATLLEEGSPVFANVGYGMINPDITFIKDVSAFNFGSGFGKKESINYNAANLNLSEWFQREFFSIEKRLRLLKKSLQNNRKSSFTTTCNEVILDIQSPRDISFVFYNSSKNIFVKEMKRDREMAFRILDAIYIRDVVKKEFGKSIPIFECSSKNKYPLEKNFDDKDICALLKTALIFDNKTPYGIFSSKDAKWIHSFEPYIQKDIELQKLLQRNLHHFEQVSTLSRFPQVSSTFIKEATNLYPLIHHYKSEKEADEYLLSALREHLKLPHLEIEKGAVHRFVPSSFAMYTKNSCLHPGIEVRNFLEIIDDAKKNLSKEAFDSIKEDIRDNFNRLPSEISMISMASAKKNKPQETKVDSKNPHLKMYKAPENVLVLIDLALKAYENKDYLGKAPKELLVLMMECLNNKSCQLTLEKRDAYKNTVTQYRNQRYKDLVLEDTYSSNKTSCSCIIDTLNPLKLLTKFHKSI